jgi:hypothetical protein
MRQNAAPTSLCTESVAEEELIGTGGGDGVVGVVPEQRTQDGRPGSGGFLAEPVEIRDELVAEMK